MSYEDGKAGEPKDVTPGDRDAYPTSMTFSVGDDFTFSPDGKYLVFTAVPAKDEAWSTNYDLCRVPVTGGTTKWETLTADNPAADNGPQFSPDGKRLAYRAQKRPGAEADRWELMVCDCDAGGRPAGKPASATPKWDRSVDSFVWQGDGFLLTAEQHARTPLWRLGRDGAEPTVVIEGGSVQAPTVSAAGPAAFALAKMSQPPEVHTLAGDKENGREPRNVSQANKALLAKLELPRPESVTVAGAGGTPMQMWILKPPGFDAKKRWPLAFLVHGGPQGAWDDNWSWRWNPELWAAQGYVVALPNPRGSTGFGQKYVDEISGDWGGKVYEDLMAGLAHLEKQPYVDADRMAAAGASFGGYMMSWFSVNTGKFKTLITHCGVWNFERM
jgi:dipeptidyl aminopeptidase/acylaminoacyl peptidase